MSNSLLVTLDTVALLVSIVISALASYRALTSRRVLASPLYRSRALWTGTVALVAIGFEALTIAVDYTVPSTATSGAYPVVGSWGFYAIAGLAAAGSVVVFAWVDRTIGVAMELDFLHRDALGWKRLRPAAGAALVAGAIGAEVFTIYWQYLASVVLLAALAAYMAAALVISGSRVRDDTMRRYMKWMGFSVISLIFFLATTSVNAYLNFPLAIFAYFLYRISTSLLKTAPLRTVTETFTASGPSAPVRGREQTQAPR